MNDLIVLNDLIADFSLTIPAFPIRAEDLIRIEQLDLGPGGATNIAIMAARLGLAVAALGEVGDDRFGEVVLTGLRREGVTTEGVVVTPGAQTPVAGVVVDGAGEPAYLGFPGSLQLAALPEAWQRPLTTARALFVDGWVESEVNAAINVAALTVAAAAAVTTFFDPGPGNPAIDGRWQQAALAQTAVCLATEAEAERLTGEPDPERAGRVLLEQGPQLVLIKQGAAGLMALTADEVVTVPGTAVPVVDKTGAGDSVAGAVIYATLQGWPLARLATLANATGAAKVQKRGTGHAMPTVAEVNEMLRRVGEQGVTVAG